MKNVIKYITVTVKHIPTQTIFYNDAKTQVFYKNDCGTGFSSDTYTYFVPANKYQGTTKDEANNYLNVQGQANANTVGVCTPVPYIEGRPSMYMMVSYSYFVGNSSPGDTFKWRFPQNRFKEIDGINTNSVGFTVKRDVETSPYNFQLFVDITKPDGRVITLSKPVTILWCGVCPL